MKLCSKCGQEKAITDFHKSSKNKDGRRGECKVCNALRSNDWRARNPERARAISLASHRRCKAKRASATKAYYRKNATALKAKEMERQRKLKEAAFAAYGGYKCRCCGETQREFLCLDHVANDGSTHRKQVGPKSLYLWLRDNGYPPILQVLCYNCNQGKQLNGGVCPHQTARGQSCGADYTI